MPRLSINELTTYRWSLAEDVTGCVEFGVPALGVWRQKLSDFGEQQARELLESSRIEVSNLMWAGGFTGSEGRSFGESIEDGLEAVRLAALLRAGCLVVYSGARNNHTHSHSRRLMISALKQLSGLAEDLEVTLAVEPVHANCADEWTFLNDIDDALQLLSQVDHPRVRLAIDTYHCGHDDRVLDDLAAAAPHVAIVHLGDGRCQPGCEQNRCRLGEGNLPLREMTRALSEGGYDGDYDVLLRGEDVEPFSYEDLIAHSKRAFAELLGSHAI